MLLAIDAGNTNTVFAVYGDGDGDGEAEGEDAKVVLGQWRAATNADRTADEYAVWLSQLMALKGLARENVQDAIISTVVPQALFSLRTLCRSYFDCDPLVVGQGVDLGIEALVDSPDEVGSDRLVNAVAAHQSYPGPLILIDFGTATTFDVVDAEGNFRGGAFAPGINLSLEALHSAAAKLPRIAVERPAEVIGRNTVACMQSGVYWGYVSLIEGIVGRIKQEFRATVEDSDMTVVATGGLAPLFADGTDVIQHVDGELTLRGLVALHRHNRVPA